MAVIATERDAKPLCPCCEGSGGHGYRAYARGISPEDDDEDCTNCNGQGRTYHTDARRDSCSGFRTLMRRVNR